MASQRQAPGLYINETGTAQRQAPGLYINETSGAGEVTIVNGTPASYTITAFEASVTQSLIINADPSSVTITAYPAGVGAEGPGVAVTQAAAVVLEASSGDVRTSQAATLVLTFEPVFADLATTQGFALVVTDERYPVRLSQMPVLVLCHERPALTQECQCWSITRKDGTVLRFTTHDAVVHFKGHDYSPCESLSATAASAGPISGGSGGDVQVSGILSADAITAEDLAAGVYDGAKVEVWIAQWGDADPGFCARRLTAGYIGAVECGVNGYKADLQSAAARIQQQAIIEVFSPSCQYEFGDSRCGYDLASATVSSTVTGAYSGSAYMRESNRGFMDSARVEADGTFDFGVVTWLTGDNAGVISRVKSFAAGAVSLLFPVPSPIKAGDTYTMAPGCAKTKAACQALNNYVNFGGYADIPGLDAVLNTPNAKG